MGWALPNLGVDIGRGWVRAGMACLLSGLALACGEGPVLVLGDLEPPRFRFGPPELVAGLASAAKTDNPTLTADMLEIYFTSERAGAPADVYVATRSDRSARFEDVSRVAAVSAAGVETSPAVSADGLTLWVASDRSGGQGGLDIWVSTREARAAPWSAPDNVRQLNSDGQDIPRPLGLHERVMPMASDRDTPPYYRVQLAERDDAGSPFGPPSTVAELVFVGESTVDAFLTDDGLRLLYVSGPAFGPADMYIAYRRSIDEPFERPTPVDDLNTPSDERDPWLSPDGRELYFSSDRSGHYQIYVANVWLESP